MDFFLVATVAGVAFVSPFPMTERDCNTKVAQLQGTFDKIKCHPDPLKQKEGQ